VIVLAALATVLWGAGPAQAEPEVGGQNTHDGSIISGSDHTQNGFPGLYQPGQPYVHSSGPPPPLYKDYYTPACSSNGPPNGGNDAMCMAAVSVCKARGQDDAIFM
jgi:hypothetical protein